MIVIIAIDIHKLFIFPNIMLHLHLLFDQNTEIVLVVLEMLLIDLEVLIILVLRTLQ